MNFYTDLAQFGTLSSTPTEPISNSLNYVRGGSPSYNSQTIFNDYDNYSH